MPGDDVKSLPTAIRRGQYYHEGWKKEVSYTSLNTVGMRYIQHYYAHKDNTPNHKTFCLDDPRDLAYVLRVLPNDGIYGFIIRNDRSHHKTPIVLKKSGDKIAVIVLDSLGVKLNRNPLMLFKVHVEAAIRSGYGKAVKISYTEVDFQRQSDYHSCSSEAHIVLKEALKMGVGLFTYYNLHEETDVPAEIAKYTQGLKRVSTEYSHDIHPKRGQFEGLLDSTSVAVNAAKHQDKGSTESLRQYFNRHQSGRTDVNSALDERREKQLQIVKRYEKDYKADELREMQLQASGLDLILQTDPNEFADLFNFPDDFMDILENIGYLKTVSTSQGVLEAWNFDLLKSKATFDPMMQNLENLYQTALEQFLEGKDISYFNLVGYRVLKQIFTDKFAKHHTPNSRKFAEGLFSQGTAVSAPASYRGEPPIVGDALLLPEIPLVTAAAPDAPVTSGMKNS